MEMGSECHGAACLGNDLPVLQYAYLH